jgi:outer membrane protein
MRTAPLLLGLLLCAAGTSPARAGEPPASPPQAPVKTTQFTHDDALRIASESNLSLLVRGLDRARAEHAAEAARRPYVPEVGLSAAVKESVGQNQRAFEWIPSLSYTSPVGTSLTAQARFVDGTSGNPESTRSLTIEISQALLKHGPYAGATAGLRQVDLDVQIARERFREELNALLIRADRAYWELALAREDLEIKRRSRDLARSQFEETKENIRRGLLAPGEIFVVEENLVNFEQRLSVGEESLTLAESAVRRLLRLGPTDPVPAVFEGDPKADVEVTEADSLDIAQLRNPTVLAAKLTADRARLGITGDLGEALPQLDLFGSLGTQAGHDSTLTPLLPGPDLRAGVRVAVPIYWGPDSARVNRARTEYSQRKLELQEQQETTLGDVRDASTRLRARRQRLDFAARLVGLAQSKLDVDREKYKSGLSTLADVVRFQRDLDAALSNVLRARLELLTTRSEILAARGDLHERSRIAVK